MILETNAVSAAIEKDRQLLQAMRGRQHPLLPVIVVGEYRYGIRRSKQSSRLAAAFAAMLEGIETLEVIAETAEHYATIRYELQQAGTPIPANDIWIAALARQHGREIVSRDTHFDAVQGVKRVSW
ncbi:MAG: PIN domain-containing protein [Planctomycetota bacterium]